MRTNTVLTKQTVDLFKDALAQNQRAGVMFCSAYEAGLVDVGGAHWRDLGPEDMTHVFQSVSRQAYKLLVKEMGFDQTAFYRYAGGARRAILTGLPFKFAKGNTTAYCRKAITIAAEDKEGTHQEKMQRAMAQVNAERNDHTAANRLKRRGLYIAPPRIGTEPNEYCEEAIKALANYLHSEELGPVFTLANCEAAELLDYIKTFLARPLDSNLRSSFHHRHSDANHATDAHELLATHGFIIEKN